MNFSVSQVKMPELSLKHYPWEPASINMQVAALVVFGWQQGSVPILQSLRLFSK